MVYVTCAYECHMTPFSFYFEALAKEFYLNSKEQSRKIFVVMQEVMQIGGSLSADQSEVFGRY